MPALLVASAIVNMPVVASAIGSAASVSLGIDKVSEKTTNGQILAIVDVPHNAGENGEMTPDVLPQYPGGENEMFKYLAMNVHYPQTAMAAGVQGRVVVEFVVEKDGSLGNITVLKSVSPDLDAEAVRVAETMPAWTPGQKDGQPVRCKMALPVSFKLTSSDKCGLDAVKEYNAKDKDVMSGKTVDDVVVVGYGTMKKSEDEAPVVSTIKMKNDIVDYNLGSGNPVYFVDGEQVSDIKNIDPDKIKSITVKKNDARYPDGAIYVELKK